MTEAENELERATRELYAVAPDNFLAKRAEFVEQARADGDSTTAQAIAKLRKPTAAAWIVNALASSDATLSERLAELGDRLRAAQYALDAATLRELSPERRALVSKLTADAFELAGRATPSTALHDEVHGTFDAAVADPDVAERLGLLQRAESFSGFGFSSSGQPQLTLMRGGKDKPTDKPARKKTTPAQRRQHQRALAAARRVFDQAEAELEQAQSDETTSVTTVAASERRLNEAKEQLETARHGLEQDRENVKRWKARRRDARKVLDRAERDAQR